jgi:hypothetical protein
VRDVCAPTTSVIATSAARAANRSVRKQSQIHLSFSFINFLAIFTGKNMGFRILIFEFFENSHPFTKEGA